MGGTRGQDHKVYESAAGSWGAESFTEIATVVNDEWTRERADIPLPYKGEDYQRHAAGQINMTFDITLRYRTTDTERDTLESHFASNTIPVLAFTNGDIGTSGTKYWKAECVILSIGETHNIDEGVEQTYTIAVADTDNDPTQVTVA